MNHQRNYVGKNGKVVCSREYNQEMQKKSFFQRLSTSLFLWASEKICFRSSEYAEKVCDELSNYLDQGDRNKDYILDENGKICFTAIEQCGKAGISAGLKSKWKN